MASKHCEQCYNRNESRLVAMTARGDQIVSMQWGQKSCAKLYKMSIDVWVVSTQFGMEEQLIVWLCKITGQDGCHLQMKLH